MARRFCKLQTFLVPFGSTTHLAFHLRRNRFLSSVSFYLSSFPLSPAPVSFSPKACVVSFVVVLHSCSSSHASRKAKRERKCKRKRPFAYTLLSYSLFLSLFPLCISSALFYDNSERLDSELPGTAGKCLFSTRISLAFSLGLFFSLLFRSYPCNSAEFSTLANFDCSSKRRSAINAR